MTVDPADLARLRGKRRAKQRAFAKKLDEIREDRKQVQIARERFGKPTLKRNKKGANVKPEFRRHI